MEHPVYYITDNDSLQKVVEGLKGKQAIAIDLEFDKNHYRYGFNLCLMQLFDGENCFLIDPLADLNIETIFPILENEDIQKLCFAFNEDMRLLTHLGAVVKGVRDLAVARILTGKQSLSLSNTLVEELNLEAQVSQQKSNWFQRPLTEEQKHYAALDVVDLFELNKKLEKQLEEKGRLEWYEQEMHQFENANWVADPFEVVPEKDRRDLTMQQWLRYEKLMQLRDEFSRKLNRPGFKVIDKNIMKDIAKSPKMVEEWSKLKRVHPKYRNDKVKNQLVIILKEVENEILRKGIKNDHSARKTLTREEKLIKNQRRNRLNQLKDTFFKPVKASLIEEIGENLSNYILSNRRIQDIVFQNTVLLPYQRKMIIKIAKDKGFNLPDIL